ncbi:hypothetical protein LPH50_11010 [Xylella taiwanensis]|uniref:Uncharacterized protein n=1 Tax=Xylella taiwanensis TaxID=1444770 RepID=Z9JG14_9GAMM|nr:hypothetical protein [Xylella taiwanensis]EWS77109.1 hypothetical protein AF72_12585 [Xylella taiwanensis]MCD8456458.1 hypothetical protein [Xylella taiwanensis]MCD8458865.1 hypothetical protein [Xylella taiwanensis]MCD8461002.1 hypothetical protein [Xylella taiwanensis]MCD8462937.1 hypothetical protein [Xylella taiwanensis]
MKAIDIFAAAFINTMAQQSETHQLNGSVPSIQYSKMRHLYAPCRDDASVFPTLN